MKIKILIVDDSRFTRLMIKKLLRDLDLEIQILEAGCGKEAIEVFQQESPDLMTLDLLMPGMHGSEVLKLIRSDNKSCFIAVVSSDIQESTRTQINALGANLFIGKPLTSEKLTALIQDYRNFRKSVEN